MPRTFCDCYLLLPAFAILSFASTPQSAPSSSTSSSPSSSPSSTTSRLLLVSFDGFRHDYLDKTHTPNFDRLVRSGTKAKWVKDAFISKTFPNHFTIVTGLYEESHGIVSNSFYDPHLNESFSMSEKESKWWSVGAEPIWVTNQLQKRDAQTGVFFWPGSETKIKGVRPTYFKTYNSSVAPHERIDAVVSWFTHHPTLNLALLYFSEPDHTAHWYGPDSLEVLKQIENCDALIGYLLNSLEHSKLLSSVNVIVTADHGFATLKDAASSTVLERILAPKGLDFDAYGSSPVLGIWPKQKDNATAIQSIYHALKSYETQAPISVYLREDIPAAYHYSSSLRIAPVLVVADLGHGVVDSEEALKNYSKRHGEHGYDNRLMEMHPFFLASGPAFKTGGFTSEPFDNVDIYPLMCLILGLTPAPNNGSLTKICTLTTLPECGSGGIFGNFGFWALTILGLGVCLLVATAFIFATVRRQRRLRLLTIGAPFDSRGVPVESAATDVRWDEDDCQVESIFTTDNSRASKWRRWSWHWKRKWSQWRHSRRGAEGGDEGESLLVGLTAAEEETRRQSDDPLKQLPQHLVDAVRR